MRAGGVMPDEEGLLVLDGPLHEVDGLSKRLIVIGLHAFLGHLTGALDLLLAHHAETRIYRLVDFVGRPGVDRVAWSELLEELGVLWVIDVLRLLQGV